MSEKVCVLKGPSKGVCANKLRKGGKRRGKGGKVSKEDHQQGKEVRGRSDDLSPSARAPLPEPLCLSPSAIAMYMLQIDQASASLPGLAKSNTCLHM